MYGKESREDGEIRFHYRREERTGKSDEENPQGKSFFQRFFRLNRTTIIILLDIIVLTVVFMIFRPVLVKRDHIFENDTYRFELSGFLFNEKAYISLKIEALEDSPGGPIDVRVYSVEGGDQEVLSDFLPKKTGVLKTLRLEMPVEEEQDQIYAEIDLVGIDDPVILTATLKE